MCFVFFAILFALSDFAHMNDNCHLGLDIHVPKSKVRGINCAELFQGNANEMKKAYSLMEKNPKILMKPTDYLYATKNCKAFREERRYSNRPLSEEEKDFPIAFSIMAYKDIEQIERLFRAIYQPQNYYCIHVDKKSPDDFYNALKQISRCFDNVILASKRIDVRWAEFSVLEQELTCMEELLAFAEWKYFLNLAGQEFPLRTNHEMVKIFKAYNGANDIEGTISRYNVQFVEMTIVFILVLGHLNFIPPVRVATDYYYSIGVCCSIF